MRVTKFLTPNMCNTDRLGSTHDYVHSSLGRTHVIITQEMGTKAL